MGSVGISCELASIGVALCMLSGTDELADDVEVRTGQGTGCEQKLADHAMAIMWQLSHDEGVVGPVAQGVGWMIQNES